MNSNRSLGQLPEPTRYPWNRTMVRALATVVVLLVAFSAGFLAKRGRQAEVTDGRSAPSRPGAQVVTNDRPRDAGSLRVRSNAGDFERADHPLELVDHDVRSGPIERRSIQVRHVNVDDMARLIGDAFPNRLHSVRIDAANNSLTVAAQPTVLDDVQRTVSMFDTRSFDAQKTARIVNLQNTSADDVRRALSKAARLLSSGSRAGKRRR